MVLRRLPSLPEEPPRPAPIIAGDAPWEAAPPADDADAPLRNPAASPVAPLMDDDTGVAFTGSFA